VVSGTRKVRESKPRAPQDRIERLGKIRGAVVDVLDSAAGGTLSITELYGRLYPEKSSGDRKRWRPRDLRRRTLPMLEAAGIIVVEGDEVRLADDWFNRLRDSRELGGEIEREEIEREKHRREQKAFRRRGESRPDHHYANVGADGHVKDLCPVDVESEERPPEPEVSTLAVAVRGYLDRNPHDACQPSGWIGTTLWAYDLYPGKPTPAEIRVAVDELGGEAYLRENLERARRKGAA